MKIVILDACLVAQNKLNFDILKQLGDVFVYDYTDPCDVIDRIKDADVVIENRVKIGKKEIDNAKNLKFISTLSTGYNLIDIKYAKKRGIVVSNIPNYSTFAVAQHTVALILAVANKICKFNDFTKKSRWNDEKSLDLWAIEPLELYQKTVGIIGLGEIGLIVAKTLKTLGMNVLFYKRNAIKVEKGIEFATLDEIYEKSDIISINCPLTEDTKNMINSQTIAKMNDGVMIVNTARGAIVCEKDMVDALNSGKVSYYATDVLGVEPPSENNVLVHHTNTLITPHIAWAPLDTRARLIEILYQNIKGFLDGKPINVVSNE